MSLAAYRQVSPAAYRRVTLAAVVALFFIVVTGGAVRLTGSGLGCPDWPTCDNDRLVAPLEYHAMVEFVNRTVTGLVSVVVIVAVLGSLRRVPRRPDLVRYSLGLVAGVVGQVVLGGLTVLFDLAPPLVMGHFLLSMGLLWCAVVLHHRAGRPDDSVEVVADDPELVRVTRLLMATAAFVLFLGTVVTSTGPHGGDETAQRLGFDPRAAARVHGIAVLLFLALLLYTVYGMVRTGAAPALLRRAEVLLAVVVAQTVVGYAQYFTGVPALLVGIHIAGATAVWVAVVGLRVAVGEFPAWQHRRRFPSSSTNRTSATTSGPIGRGS
jgi:cytochrome c oxidase assembly protein subunit 15